VVARAIAKEGMDGPVYLDMRDSREQGAGNRKPGMRNRERVDWKQRFPGISEFLAGYGLELARDLVPVSPAAHYLMGGVRTDVSGRTSVVGLYAAGEAACTGVHGANRLASNSLLEGLVFGALAAEAMRGELSGVRSQVPVAGRGTESGGTKNDAGVEEWIAKLRELMWREAGLLRDGDGLRRAQAGLKELGRARPAGTTRRALEARNLLTVAQAMVQAALGREESRGAHFRTDYPKQVVAARHSIMRGGELRFAEE